MVYFVYFSPTGGTKKYITALSSLPEEAEFYDLTVKREKFSLQLEEDDLLVLAFPVYYGRIPPLFLEKLEHLQGKHTPALLLAVYGNRHYDDALKEGSDFLVKKGFIPYAGAAVIAKHTYGSIQIHRPDREDVEQVKGFFLEAIKKEKKKAYAFPGNFPYRDLGSPHFYPYTSKDCIACKACLRSCPWEAINDAIETIEEKCSACLACVDVCPMDARVLPTDYDEFARSFSEKLKEPRENEFFL